MAHEQTRNASPFADIMAALVRLDPDWWCTHWGGHRLCESRNGEPHCCRCHVPTHSACKGCGTCLPDSRRYTSRAVTRVDREYCSNACRQRAYRRRTTERSR
jgi:hypothetical protein